MPSRKKPAPDTSSPDSAPPAKKPTSRSPRKSPAKSAPAAEPSEAPAKTTRAKKAQPQAEKPVASNGRGYDLVIVESPTKAKTINKYLGSGYRVLASYGHVRDLPSTGKKKGEEVTGIQIASGWVPRYVVEDRDSGGKGKGGKGFNRRSPKDILEELRREAAKANRVYLASDPDREGEAIAWHIADELALTDDRTFRIRFNEITRAAVNQAISNPDHIDMNRVKAQEARRILDRVVGYPLSNLLGKKVTQGLSAGRVQSVAVRLIVEREREIEAFVSEEYWKITALLAPEAAKVVYDADPNRSKIFAKKKGKDDSATREPEVKDADAVEDGKDAEVKDSTPAGLPKPPQGTFLAELVRWDNAEFKSGNESTTDGIMAALQSATYTITKIEQKDSSQKPRPPFTTSTLQQDASQRLRFSTTKTMQVAQKLYEGVELGSEGSVALITYMRTDSTRISNDAMKMVRDHIQANYGGPYLPNKPNNYASGKSAQEAHEAIRPTDLNYSPARVAPFLQPEQLRLYTLIYNRFVASQMMPAVYAVTNVEITAGPGLFKSQGKILKFDGYQKVLPPAKQEDKILPSMRERDRLDKLDLFGSQHFTQPPDRYNEASLVRTLEKEGIGRPSTYASIISVIQNRGYVEQRERRFYATEIGKVVTDLLVAHFPKIMDLKFTSHMEEELDQIETAQTQYESVLNEFWNPFSQSLEAAQTEMPARRGVETGKLCPRCTKPLVEMYSSKTRRKFIGCSGYRDKENPCSYKETVEGEELKGPEITEFACPTCGKPMVKREGKTGPFLGCSGYPECKVTMNLDAEGKPVASTKATEYSCDKCGLPMVLREGKRGPFLACTGYPKCKNALDVDLEGKPIRPADTGINCEKCQSKMIIKKGPRGPFLSCSAYPKCKNAKPLTAELKEQLKDMLPAPAPKREKLQIAEECPSCGALLMNVQMGRGGRPFLGCSQYPKCKGTKPVTPEIEEKIQAATGTMPNSNS